MDFLISQEAIRRRTRLREPVRAVHFVLRNTVAQELLDGVVTPAATLGYNTFVIAIADALDSPYYPGTLLPTAWSVGAFSDFLATLRGAGFRVVLEVTCLTHQEKFFMDSNPSLMWNTATYDPAQPGVYDIVLPYLDNLIALFAPDAVHIGHDEVAGWNGWAQLEDGETMLPASAFIDDIWMLRDHLRTNHGDIGIWMWADMLTAPDEFPTMAYIQHFHGVATGYGQVLRDQLPRDIVICDWRYRETEADFTTLDAFRQEGFLGVTGATWKYPDAIANMPSSAAGYGANGMIATTWFHVQAKDWSTVNTILSDNAATFNAAFPDPVQPAHALNFLIDMPAGDDARNAPAKQSGELFRLRGEWPPFGRMPGTITANGRQLTHVVVDSSLLELESLITYHGLDWQVLGAQDAQGRNLRQPQAESIVDYLPGQVDPGWLRNGSVRLHHYAGHQAWSIA